jgi:hypothetical protein
LEPQSGNPCKLSRQGAGSSHGVYFKVVLSTASPAAVWEAIRDIGALHTRLVPGFVVLAEIIPGGRRVTFANGLVIDESNVSSDDSARRLVWTADLLPNEMASAVDQMMDQGAAAMTCALAKL